MTSTTPATGTTPTTGTTPASPTDHDEARRAARALAPGGPGSIAGPWTRRIPDLERRIPLWGERTPSAIPGNRAQPKLADMRVDFSPRTERPALDSAFIAGAVLLDSEEALDTVTWFAEVDAGFQKTTYEDEPFLIPYPVANPRGAVVIAPGGAFAYASADCDGDWEGRDIALRLNALRLTAFVLHYRTNPYEYPIPQLDMQRAVRLVRARADEFDLAGLPVGAMGFSAGGSLVGTAINTIKDRRVFPPGYEPDAVDGQDGTPSFAALIYPAMTFADNVPTLFALFDAAEVRDPVRRERLLDLVDCTANMDSAAIPQFVAWGDADRAVGTREAARYVRVARAKGASIAERIVEGGEHCFGPDVYEAELAAWLNEVLS